MNFRSCLNVWLPQCFHASLILVFHQHLSSFHLDRLYQEVTTVSGKETIYVNYNCIYCSQMMDVWCMNPLISVFELACLYSLLCWEYYILLEFHNFPKVDCTNIRSAMNNYSWLLLLFFILFYFCVGCGNLLGWLHMVADAWFHDKTCKILSKYMGWMFLLGLNYNVFF